MKALLVSAILSLGVVLTPAAFAQSTTPAQMPQHTSQGSGTQRANDSSGYGMEGGGTSNASVSGSSRAFTQASNHASNMHNEGRNGLFAHH
ncbi:hypothetical protein [Paraburkholderia unamae]|uniref:Uncharacterized protein n=1 Tax=Paraburkholderia unamae TaxID=219649 RepID=A0ABX5KX65_9BURK|nr:hypothetical protein [Paraburkholderia unamae]PVX85165.1 hypothetical protein C7402_104409 [Paraburkholderia unamae]